MSENQKSLGDLAEKVHRAEVIHHRGQLMLPDDMDIDDAITLLKDRKKYLSQEIDITRDFNAFVWDGALALQTVLKEHYGWVPHRPIPGFLGETPPQMIGVEVAYQKTRQVPWGQFGIPGTTGYMQTGHTRKDGLIIFRLTASVRRKDEDLVEELFEKVAVELRKGSIYSGAAISMRFRDDDGEFLPIPVVQFLRTDVTPDQLIFAKDLEAAIKTNLFTPITRSEDCIANGIPVKRGVLLGGEYGTGKTLAAAVAANLAVKNGVTYLYVPRADELKDAIQFGRQYSDKACVIFCEDIDRVMRGERSVRMDDLLNIVDGIDGKSSNIIVVFTTNFLENINPAMLRPGRLDAVIEVTAPDAEAAERLIRHYGAEAIDESTDLSSVGGELAGHIPAILAEVVKRAKLSELSLTEPGGIVTNLSAEALMIAARTMTKQLSLLEPKVDAPEPELDRALAKVVRGSLNGRYETTKKVPALPESEGIAAG